MMNSQAASPGLDILLQNARRRAGLTQQQLAGLSTVSVRAIRDLEQGRVQHPRKETLRLLADAMRLTDARRVELELAVDNHSVGRVFQDLYSAELVAPPAPQRPMVGRRAELDALVGRLASEHERLLTLVGLPGTGKSRLAQEAALVLHARERMPVLWVPMDRAAQQPGGPSDGPGAAMADWVRELVLTGGRFEELTGVIGSKPTLIVLDGHDADPSYAQPLLGLLRACERLRVLVTSCRPVQFPGGRTLSLPPLPLPALAGPVAPGASLAADRPAVELMLSYVSQMRPDFLPTDSATSTVDDICQALDGIPQALEAAASWLLLYSPEQLLDIARTTPLVLVDGVTPADPGAGAGSRLSERLTAVVEELRPHECALLATLASLRAPWTVDDAARACGMPLAEAAREVHALLLRGLIRRLPTEPGGPVGFTVLNLVSDLAESTAADGPRLLADQGRA